MTQFGAISDLSKSWAMLRNGKAMRLEMDTAAREFSTGERNGSDIARAGQSDRLVAIDRSLNLLDHYKIGLSQGQSRADATQASLQSIRTSTADIMTNVLSLAKQDSFQSADIQASEAVGELNRVASSLNTNVAGHSLFSGSATDRSAISDPATMLSDVESILSASPDVATAIVSVDFYFNDPAGGFMTSIYGGSSTAGPDISVAEGERVGFDVRADDPAIRETLRNLTLVAAVANGAYTGSLADQKALLVNAGETNLSTSDSLIRVQEKLGYSQEKLSESTATNDAARLRLELARNDVAAVDEYEAAARFQELEAQVERVYTVTARLGSLSLANFMR